eukprot:6214238-Pleurochrysis_carterae.AAC.1
MNAVRLSYLSKIRDEQIYFGSACYCTYLLWVVCCAPGSRIVCSPILEVAGFGYDVYNIDSRERQ